MASRAITALFDDYEDAAKAIDRVEAEGIPHADISIVASNADERHSQRVTTAPGSSVKPTGAAASDASDGAGAGATVGTVLGGGAGLLAALGLIAIPGIGPVVAAGWLVTALTGAGIGAAAGGLLGALTGAGLSDADAETYAEGVRRGGTLVTVRADETKADRVIDILDGSGSIDMDERAQGWRAQGWTGGTAGAPAKDEIGSTATGAAASTSLDTPGGDDMLRPEAEPRPATEPETSPASKQRPGEIG